MEVLEAEIKEEIDEQVYEEQISMMEMVLNVDAIIAETKEFREKYSKYI